ncbi:cartilage acidic protein 1-like [Haliotis cracherodii]|uniref:cartilage acidic protein 1-like n=1 Tax=Haliotis cracherodii TaxID=6455 RepID=UPI0039EADBDA
MKACLDMVLVAGYLLLSAILCSTQTEPMFIRKTPELFADYDTTQLNYGVAVSDVDGDGEMEWIVAGFNGPNMVFKYDHVTRKYINLVEIDGRFSNLSDIEGQAISVVACDLDGDPDGREEIYILNTNDQYWGSKRYKDKLFKFRNGRYEDLFSDTVNSGMSHMFAGRSVACVDRKGTGKYGFLLATYSRLGVGEFALMEMNESSPDNDVVSGRVVICNVGSEAGINISTGGQGIAVGPILGDDGMSDIFFVNEGNSGVNNRGDNALFKNRGDGTYEDVARITGVTDRDENGRGVTLADFNNDGLVDIVYGNWVGPHRLYLQRRNGSDVRFENAASREFARPSPIRTLIAADFDNDGILELFLNNIYYQFALTPNLLYKVRPNGDGVDIENIDVGDALELNGRGTGASVTDLDGDGRLELLVSHGESTEQPLELYHVHPGEGNRWIRIMPLTRVGAPARGAKVTVMLTDTTRQSRVIDGGSGYLCQMEPVAHFGLGQSYPAEVSIQWPDGNVVTKAMGRTTVNSLHRIGYSGFLETVPRPDPGSQGGETVSVGTRENAGILSFLVFLVPSYHLW